MLEIMEKIPDPGAINEFVSFEMINCLFKIEDDYLRPNIYNATVSDKIFTYAKRVLLAVPLAALNIIAYPLVGVACTIESFVYSIIAFINVFFDHSQYKSQNLILAGLHSLQTLGLCLVSVSAGMVFAILKNIMIFYMAITHPIVKEW